MSKEKNKNNDDFELCFKFYEKAIEDSQHDGICYVSNKYNPISLTKKIEL